MVDLSLRQREAQLVYLATLYHLGRPGSELDPATHQPHGLGLRPVNEALATNLQHAAVTLVLTDYQLERLGEALLGTVNELKQVGMSGHSVVAGFVEETSQLFPEVSTEEPGAALDLAAEMLMLRRRLDGAVQQARTAVAVAQQEQWRAETASRKPWWKVWER